jgi:hypothetical protein
VAVLSAPVAARVKANAAIIERRRVFIDEKTRL